MLILKSVPLFMVAALAFLPGIAGAASVDIQSGSSRVVIDRDGQIFIRGRNVGRDVYSDSNFDDEDVDRVIPRIYPYSNRLYRPSSLRRERDYRSYYRGRCKGYSHSHSSYGSRSYSSSTICN
jgi:hypothetical protein